MDFGIIRSSLPFLLQGAVRTIEITVLAVAIGIALGTVLGLARLSRVTWIAAAAEVYIEVIRGTPLLVQLFMVFYGIPQVLQIHMNEFVAGVVAFGLNSAAYVAEIIRAGIQSIDRGQTEAALSLGLPPLSVMRYVILPQAFKRILPPLVNEFTSLLKNSSLVATISVVELTRAAQLITARTFKAFEMLTTISVIYLVMTLSLSRVARALERRWRVSD
ncbi:amino acid ABC transporter permease [Caldinitratiruptor microaerophilus]|uniref:Glutamine ABC transporter permease n=1 Tax=Caldinitratiruptor microaerophilus TaxID=671077 RepID=A0AA35CMQ9_9FIRM|nr:amino acid ABC transporter permease [Caldinitratiruptor microaerophilus]BDG60145.1 glutamine ABC transporter permease [Caldinitratiruptor microaerophilus]